MANPVAKEAFPKTVVQQTRGGELDIKIAHKTLWAALCLNGLGALLVCYLGQYERLDFNKRSRCCRRVPNRICFRLRNKFDDGNEQAGCTLRMKYIDAWSPCYDNKNDAYDDEAMCNNACVRRTRNDHVFWLRVSRVKHAYTYDYYCTVKYTPVAEYFVLVCSGACMRPRIHARARLTRSYNTHTRGTACCTV